MNVNRNSFLASLLMAISAWPSLCQDVSGFYVKSVEGAYPIIANWKELGKENKQLYPGIAIFSLTNDQEDYIIEIDSTSSLDLSFVSQDEFMSKEQVPTHLTIYGPYTGGIFEHADASLEIRKAVERQLNDPTIKSTNLNGIRVDQFSLETLPARCNSVFFVYEDPFETEADTINLNLQNAHLDFKKPPFSEQEMKFVQGNFHYFIDNLVLYSPPGVFDSGYDE